MTLAVAQKPWSLGGWLWGRSHCSLCLLEKGGQFHTAPMMGEPAKTVDNGTKSSSIAQKLRFWLWRSSLITTALCSSGSTGPSSPVQITQPYSEAGLLTPGPLQWNCLWWGRGERGVPMARQAHTPSVSGPEESNPIPSYTKVFLPCELTLDPEYPTLLGMIHLRNGTKPLPRLWLGSLAFWFWQDREIGMKYF